jgi:quinol monooxygenase YgiN
MYTSKSAFQQQLEDTTFFQAFERMVVEEKMYAREGTMESWYLTAGFVTRCQGSEEGGGRVVVSVRKLTCMDGEKDAVVKGLDEFADWSRGSDTGVLSFAVFTRKKAEREVLVYVRYRDEATMRRVEDRPEFQNFWWVDSMVDDPDVEWFWQWQLCRTLAAPSLVSEESNTSVWHEVEDSFVAPVVGIGKGNAKL